MQMVVAEPRLIEVVGLRAQLPTLLLDTLTRERGSLVRAAREQGNQNGQGKDRQDAYNAIYGLRYRAFEPQRLSFKWSYERVASRPRSERHK
jgi:hypothetical protein